MKSLNRLGILSFIIAMSSNCFADCDSLKKVVKDYKSGKVTSESVSSQLVRTINQERKIIAIKLDWLDRMSKYETSLDGKSASRESWDRIADDLMDFNSQANCIQAQTALVMKNSSMKSQKACISSQSHMFSRYSGAQKLDRILHDGSISGLLQTTLENDVILFCIIK